MCNQNLLSSHIQAEWVMAPAGFLTLFLYPSPVPIRQEPAHQCGVPSLNWGTLSFTPLLPKRKRKPTGNTNKPHFAPWTGPLLSPSRPQRAKPSGELSDVSSCSASQRLFGVLGSASAYVLDLGSAALLITARLSAHPVLLATVVFDASDAADLIGRCASPDVTRLAPVEGSPVYLRRRYDVAFLFWLVVSDRL